jgi:hypothetical protein
MCSPARIGVLPPVQKKLLAMYYVENLPLAEIAAHLGLSEIGTCQILVETSARLFAIRRVPFIRWSKRSPPIRKPTQLAKRKSKPSEH